MATEGEKLKDKLGLEKLGVVKIRRILLNTFSVFGVYYNSRQPNSPITTSMIDRSKIAVFSKSPFNNLVKMLPAIDIKDFKNISNANVYLLVDLAGDYGVNGYKTTLPEMKLNEFVDIMSMKNTMNLSIISSMTWFRREFLQGKEDKLAKLTDVIYEDSDANLLLIFETPATTVAYSDDKEYKQVNPANNFQLEDNPSKTYQLYLRMLDITEWLGTTDEAITSGDVSRLFEDNNAQVFSTSPSFHWQGYNHNISKLDGSVFPTDIFPEYWITKMGFENDYILDKHLFGLVRSIDFFASEIAEKLNEILK